MMDDLYMELTEYEGVMPDLEIKWQATPVEIMFGKMHLEPGAEKKIKEWVSKIRQQQLAHDQATLKRSVRTRC